MDAPFRIAIVGAGKMGIGFAVHFRLSDLHVTLIDHRQSNLDTARRRIRETIRFLNNQGVSSISPDAVLDRVGFTLDTQAGVADADIVLETVAEDLAVKRSVFQTLGSETSSNAILATNTSGIPITDIADGFSFAKRIIGCHWLYPPYLLPTVEVIRGEATADETVERLVSFIEAIDRKPIIVRRDVPGFVWNRVQFAVLRECLFLATEGVASIEDINTAIRDGYARRTAVIGPFETVDLAGLTLFRTVAANLYPALADTDSPSQLFDEHLADGRTGVVAGAGFFDYDINPEQVEQTRDETLIDFSQVLEK